MARHTTGNNFLLTHLDLSRTAGSPPSSHSRSARLSLATSFA